MRLSFVGEMGWEIHVPNSAALDVYHALFDAGRDLGLKNSGYRAMDSLSMEKGLLGGRFMPLFFRTHKNRVRNVLRHWKLKSKTETKGTKSL